MTNRTYPQGVPCWVDTGQPDVEAAAEFYGGIFGWTFEDAMPPGAPGRYVIARLDGQDAGAIAGPRPGTAAWSTYVAVDDADDAAQRLVSAGATVRSAPADAGEGGRGAVLADPEGIEFGIWQARRRLGAQVVNQPGAWNFSDLRTTDPRAAMEFYQEAFGWQVDDLGFAAMIRRPGYGDHLEATVDPGIRARQSGVGTPPGFEDAIAWVAPAAPGEQPRWHVSFTVADRDQTAADAERLGAQVPGAGGHRVDAHRTDPRPPGSGVHRQPVHAAIGLSRPVTTPQPRPAHYARRGHRLRCHGHRSRYPPVPIGS